MVDDHRKLEGRTKVKRDLSYVDLILPFGRWVEPGNERIQTLNIEKFNLFSRFVHPTR